MLVSFTHCTGAALPLAYAVSPPPAKPPRDYLNGALAARLALHYNVYALDLPGYGRSDRPARVPTVAGFSAILARWMDVVGLARAAFVANSFGCQIVADLPVRSPARVARAILVGPTVDPAHHTLGQQGARLLLDGAREPRRYLPLLLVLQRRFSGMLLI